MKQQNLKIYLIKGISVIIGIFMVGIAVGLFKFSEMGADPFTAMNTGISFWISMQFGTLQLIVNAVLLIFIFFFKKQFIGFGTIFNMIFVGYTADFTLWILNKCPFSLSSWEIRILLLMTATLFICMGDALYISADMGIAPYDAAGYIVEILTKKTISFRTARILLDIICVSIGFLTGLQTEIQWKIIGIGTVLLASCTGPLIQFFRIHWSDKLFKNIVS